MGKGRVIEDKPRKRKISAQVEEVKTRNNPKTNSISKPIHQPKLSPLEKSRTRKPYRRQHGKLFFDFGKELPKKIILGILISLLSVVLIHFIFQRYSILRRQRQVYTPIQLPRLIGLNKTNAESSPNLFWGSYRPGIYFGMSHRTPHSLLFGLAWSTFESTSLKIRHECTAEDKLKSYNWIEHDGRNFGVQTIIDGNNNITVSFVKRPASPYGGDWTARIAVTAINKSVQVKPMTFMFYTYLPDSTRGMVQKFTHETELKRLRGFTQELGAFQVNFHTNEKSSAKIVHKSHLSGLCEREDKILPSLVAGLAFADAEHSILVLLEKQHFPKPIPPVDTINFWVTGIVVIPSVADRKSLHYTNTVLEVEFVSQASTSSDALPLIGSQFDNLLARLSFEFHTKFDKKFPSYVSHYPEEKLALSKVALSNLLGGMGYFYGVSSVYSPLLGPESVSYWPTSLFTATPSRQQFPRGFLWDEGFHGLILAQWDVELSLQSLSHWLDVMNGEGWIPREQILGFEALSRVPSEFVVQSTAVANPPTLILVVEQLLERLPAMDLIESKMFSDWSLLAFPRLHSWFTWFNTTQTGLDPSSYRWRGRPADNPFQLNPLVLSSGLDDYPRASHPTVEERHLDLRCWMALFARVMVQLSEYIENVASLEQKSFSLSTDMKNVRSIYSIWAKTLTNPNELDRLHWSKEHEMFADFGLHTDAVSLARPQIKTNSQHQTEELPQKRRRVLKEPKYQFITSAFGYISLFPLLLRILPPDSPRIESIVDKMSNPKLILSPHGLRSLSLTSPYYRQANTEHDPPYWRGSLWINMNYLAVRSLRYYAKQPGIPIQLAHKLDKLSTSLTTSLVSTVIGELNRTGFLWEQYDDSTGRGQRAHPFSGWTALITLVMTDEVDFV